MSRKHKTFVINNQNPNDFQITGPSQTQAPSGNLYCRLNQFEAAGRPSIGGPPVAVRLGPGLFQTKGYTPAAAASWIPRGGIAPADLPASLTEYGMKFFGSGIGVTVLQLVGAVIDNNLNGGDYAAIGGPYNNIANGFEASDFTIDCNIAGQPSQLAACGGLGVVGTHARLRRIRVINFGTQTWVPTASPPATTECFVLGIGAYQISSLGLGAEGAACLLLDCIMEQPGLNNTRETTGLYIDSTVVGESMIYHRGSVIRNCYANCEYRVNPAQILQITISAGLATVMTALPHGHVNGDWVRISGVRLNGTIYNGFNGSYAISNASATSFQYTPTPTPSANPDSLSDMWVGKFPSQVVNITGISVGTPVGGQYPVTVTTAAAHYLVPNGTVLINNIANASNWNGPFQVQSVQSPTSFIFQSPTTYSGFDSTSAFIYPLFQGGSVDLGTAAVYEGNRILNCIPATYHDTYNTKDQILRNNYFRAVAYGHYQNLGGPAVSTTSYFVPLASLTASGVLGMTATATTTQPHGFSTGDQVIIENATQPQYNTSTGNSNVPWSVTVTGLSTFTYTMGGSPITPAGGNPGYQTGLSAAFTGPTQQQKILGIVGPPPTNALTYAYQSGVYLANANVDLSRFALGVTVGEVVYISRANFPGTSPPTYFNGYVYVTGVAASSFQFILPINPFPGHSSGSSASGYYGRLTAGGKIVLENNIMDLSPSQSFYYSSRAVQFAQYLGSGYFSDLVVPEVVMRRNVIRAMDGLPDLQSPPYKSTGVYAFSCGELIMEENVIDPNSPTAIQFDNCGSTEFFANQTSAGVLALGCSFVNPAVRVSELSTNIEDAALLAL